MAGGPGRVDSEVFAAAVTLVVPHRQRPVTLRPVLPAFTAALPSSGPPAPGSVDAPGQRRLDVTASGRPPPTAGE